MKQLFFIGFTATLAVLGLWQIGQGSWIYIKAELAQYLLEQAWARTVKGELNAKPWPWADTWPTARLQLPQYGVDLIVLSGASGRTLAFGPGHVSSSAPPGEGGTTIFSGHRDTHFRFLERVKEGDQIIVQRSNGNSLQYIIRAINIVEARSTKVLHDRTQSNLVLITCYPFNAITPGGPLRYVVTAEANPQRPPLE